MEVLSSATGSVARVRLGCDHVGCGRREAVQLGLPAAARAAGQPLQPGGGAAAAAAATVGCRQKSESRGCHHLLCLAGQHPAAGLHLRPHGVAPGRRALLATAAVLLRRRPLRVAQQQLRQLLVGSLAQPPLLRPGATFLLLLLASPASAQGEDLLSAGGRPAADPADLLRRLRPLPLPQLPEGAYHQLWERHWGGGVRSEEAALPHLGPCQRLRGGLHLLPGADAASHHAAGVAEAGCLPLQAHVGQWAEQRQRRRRQAAGCPVIPAGVRPDGGAGVGPPGHAAYHLPLLPSRDLCFRPECRRALPRPVRLLRGLLRPAHLLQRHPEAQAANAAPQKGTETSGG